MIDRLRRRLRDRANERRVMAAFGPFLRPLDAGKENPRRVLEEPRTAIANLRTAVEEQWSQRLRHEGPEATLGHMLDAIPENLDDEILPRVQARLAADRSDLTRTPAGAQLLALYDAAPLLDA